MNIVVNAAKIIRISYMCSLLIFPYFSELARLISASFLFDMDGFNA